MADHDRPLSPAGLDEAREVAQVMVASSAAPGFILSSTATRARQTAEIIAQALDPAPELMTSRALYLAEPDIALVQLHEIPGQVGSALLVGHNPGLEALVIRLTGDPLGFGTATLARLDADCATWAGLGDGCADTTGVWRPGG